MTNTIAYKAFNKDMTCLGFKYEIDKSYQQNGPIEVCKKGFHACLLPFDTWKYYPLSLDVKYALVEQSGDIEFKTYKVCSSEIAIKPSLNLVDMVKAQT